MVANEVHNIIEVSLGKIAKCKQQKSGVNLRRNLLVASVIQKARVVYVSEIQSFRQNQSSKKLEKLKQNRQRDSKPSTESQGFSSSSSDAQQKDVPSQKDCSAQKITATSGEERLRPQSDKDSHRSAYAYRLKPKRNRSSFESDSEDEGDHSLASKPKRLKSSIDLSRSISKSSSVESFQMNSLVNVFNSSLGPVSEDKKENLLPRVPIAMEV